MNRQKVYNEILKCGKDPTYFIKNYCRISHPTRGQIPFQLFPYQKKCIKEFQEHRFNIILKARQMGISTLCAAYAVWMSLFHKSKEIVIVATTQRVSQKLVKKCKIILQNLPDWLVLPKKTSETKTCIEFSNGSAITAVPTSPDAGRSDALSLLIIDEAAIIRDMSEIYTSAYSTLATGGDMIILSTPKGASGLYYTLYSQAEAGQNDFNPIKLMWDLHPERDEEWYIKETKNMRPHEIAQELECSFNSSNNILLDPQDMEYLQSISCEPVRKTGPGRGMWIWKSPVQNHRYILSCDIARGDREDYSAFHLIDRNENEVVAEFQEKISTDKFSYFLSVVGKEYNDALIIPENNIYGHSVIKDLARFEYPNVYHSKNKYALLADYNPISLDKEDYGFNTNGHNRDDILMKLRRLIEKRTLKVYSRRLFNELLTFAWTGSKYKAQGGANDDLIMSLAIGCYILYEINNNENIQNMDPNTLLKGMSVNSVSFDNFSDINNYPIYMPVQTNSPDLQKQYKKVSDNRELNDFSWLYR